MNKEIFVKHFNGTISEEEEKELLTWIGESQDNSDEYCRERKLWDILQLHGPSQLQFEEKEKKNSPKKWIIEIVKVAAVFLIAVFISSLFNRKSETEKQSWNTIEVPIGQRTSLTLADGTVIWLNAKSKFSFPATFQGKVREVILDGEAVFDVAHNEKQPFIVKTKTFDIKVLGTEFNVYAYDNSDIFETTLVRGKVVLENRISKQNVEMAPNDAAVYNSQNGKLKLNKVNAQESLSWKEGVYSFNNQSFSSIIQRLERYYEVSITVQNQKILENRFTGKFRYSDPIEVILEVVKKSNPFRYNKKGNEIIIY